MAQLAVTTVTRAGVAQSLASAAGGGDSYPNTGKEKFMVKNAGAAPRTVTFKCSGGDANNRVCNMGVAASTGHDVAVSVTNDSNVYSFGPFPTYFNDANGLVQVTYSAVTSVTVGAEVTPPAQ